MWDVGAHVGSTSLLCARHGANRVLAFEPVQKNLIRFKSHLDANPSLASRIEILPVAVSHTCGDSELTVWEDSSMSQIVDRNVTPRRTRKHDLETVKVDTVSLDSLLEEGRPAPRLVKIDVEGAEEIVLLGASRLISEHHPVILLEFHNTHAAVASIQFLKRYDYQIYEIRSHRLQEIEPLQNLHYGHLLAFKKSS